MRTVIRSIAATMGLGYSYAFACVCVAPGTTQESLDASDGVFLGEAIRSGSETPATAGCNAEPASGPEGTEFEVVEAFKGVADGDTVFVRHNRDSAACGIDIEVGERWLIFATDNDGTLQTGLCTSSALESKHGATLIELRGS